MSRQATLPNPDQHIKLMPTSPPKHSNQVSPQYSKRSPEFKRQNTLPNPDGMSLLHVQPQKFLPISPRQKQSFLFPHPVPAPRPFLSQQHFPTDVAEEPHQGTIVGGIAHRDHSKMIKVRSHSNEEYSFNRPYAPTENRRLLPEIPPNRSPRYNLPFVFYSVLGRIIIADLFRFRLVRQDHVKEELIRTNSQSEKRSPIKKTFAEAKQNLIEDYDYLNPSNNQQFIESDEYFVPNEYGVYAEPNEMINPMAMGTTRKPPHSTMGLKATEVFVNESPPEYFHPDDYIRIRKTQRRRKSRELPIEPEIIVSSNEDEPPKRKPEAMRSISEDSSPRVVKPVTRRSMSHPEKESQVSCSRKILRM